jgi:uncharacterized protein (DUF58 family)
VHLAWRSYLLVLLAAVLAILGIWSSDADVARLWRIPAGLLLLGLALERVYLSRQRLNAHLTDTARVLLGVPHEFALEFTSSARRPLQLRYAPAVPDGFEAPDAPRHLTLPARGAVRDALLLLPVRLGTHAWPALPARVLGPLSLAWWNSPLQPPGSLTVAPDALRSAPRLHGFGGGVRPRRVAGAGAELHQLRDYVPGDPLTRIDWKASARARTLISREFSEDQHLDIVVAIDAGRLSRVRAGSLDRFGVYANLAARLAQVITHNDDRIGLVVYADRPLASCAPARGLPAVMQLRRTLEQLSVRAAESDPTAAAVSIRHLLRHRGLVVLLTDLDDANVARLLARAVRLLAPPHLVVVAGVQSGEIAALAHREARDWRDPWVALAATEHEARSSGQRALLRRLGVPVVGAPAEHLEQAVFAQYETLRRTRRV